MGNDAMLYVGDGIQYLQAESWGRKLKAETLEQENKTLKKQNQDLILKVKILEEVMKISTEKDFCKDCEKKFGNIVKGMKEIGSDNYGPGSNAVFSLANCAKNCSLFKEHIERLKKILA